MRVRYRRLPQVLQHKFFRWSAQVRQANVFHRTADRAVYFLSSTANLTQRFQFTLVQVGTAFGDGNRPFEHFQDLGRGNVLGCAHQAIAAIRQISRKKNEPQFLLDCRQ